MKSETIDDFFEEPIDKEIEDEVNTQVVVIDYCVAFGKWLFCRI